MTLHKPIWILVLIAAPWFGTSAVTAQLISPGKLSRAHAPYEGVSQCIQCHQLGRPGIQATRCLDCHTPLKTRIETAQGYHGNLNNTNCADCHKEHLGLNADNVRLDTLTFNHTETGYALTGAHADVTCAACHSTAFREAPDVLRWIDTHAAAEGTFLGTSVQCATCHESVSPHGQQFERSPDGGACQGCHEPSSWSDVAKFDHNTARFALRGAHQTVACAACHGPDQRGDIVYRPIAFTSCATCHEDPHNGVLTASCTTCHNETSWTSLPPGSALAQTFDHQSTGYALRGAHAEANCASCHIKPGREDEDFNIVLSADRMSMMYPAIVHTSCTSCHRDAHEDQLTYTEATCASCHQESTWHPANFDFKRHNQESRFVLDGAHMLVSCQQCHGADAQAWTDRPNDQPPRGGVFAFPNLSCAQCHTDDNPHGTQFEDEARITRCETCHTTQGWAEAQQTFDHNSTGFALIGAHEAVACTACHTQTNMEGQTLFTGQESSCESCHDALPTHGTQFEGRTCESCHDTYSFRINDFNHDQTAFPLTGAHAGVACGACHGLEEDPDGITRRRYLPLPTTCVACHGSSDE